MECRATELTFCARQRHPTLRLSVVSWSAGRSRSTLQACRFRMLPNSPQTLQWLPHVCKSCGSRCITKQVGPANFHPASATAMQLCRMVQLVSSSCCTQSGTRMLSAMHLQHCSTRRSASNSAVHFWTFSCSRTFASLSWECAYPQVGTRHFAKDWLAHVHFGASVWLAATWEMQTCCSCRKALKKTAVWRSSTSQRVDSPMSVQLASHPSSSAMLIDAWTWLSTATCANIQI
mmetsp:Transcript_41576/g.124338  ORF Transcript_41576/g.124338 Transcript_41576/m.124338 type:complete len:233 (+) Transcript_41576:375-1073(+)